MRGDAFDRPPAGYARSDKRGWLKPAQTPQSGRMRALQEENQALREQFADVLERLMRLEEEKDGGA